MLRLGVIIPPIFAFPAVLSGDRRCAGSRMLYKMRRSVLVCMEHSDAMEFPQGEQTGHTLKKTKIADLSSGMGNLNGEDKLERITPKCLFF